MATKRLFIVSNRLPVNIETVDGQPSVNPSAGGLVSAISGYLEHKEAAGKKEFEETWWVGVPGCSATTWKKASRELPATGYGYLPVFIPKTVYEPYYNGFSNSAIWPLFHYFPSYAEYNLNYHDNYMEANQAFVDVLVEQLQPGDYVWIHDYHLLPMARLVREQRPDVTIGFFLHIPFPSYELIRMMPKQWQEDILLGMLGADLIGFHTIDYASHFLECTRMILGIDNDMHLLRHDDRLIKADVFPISIDFKKFNDAWDDEQIVETRADMKNNFVDKQVIFSVDRLDYTKGLSHRLKGYEYFLTHHPEYHNKVVFILVIVPSRDNISRYKERKRMVDESISNINSKIGNIHWQPVIYQYNTLTFHEMVTLYTCCDVALITPLRDGMNLVSKEFVASRKDERGVLVISEMAGAARELTDALTINPNDVKEMAARIKDALEMPVEEQQQRMSNMRGRIAQYDVNAWAEDFMEQLDLIRHKQQSFRVRYLDDKNRSRIYESYLKAERRLLLLDYDGTLSSLTSLPAMAKPGKRLLELLENLASHPKNEVCIISGRDSGTLEEWFDGLPITIISEHGARIREQGGEWQNRIMNQDNWRGDIHRIMEGYVKRCANSFIETKDFSIVWHYRNANKEQANLRSQELYAELSEFTHNLELQVMMGNKIVEVRNKGVDKGHAIRDLLMRREEFDFILAAGDDRTDEDMFQFLADNSNAYTIKIGPDASYARYNLHTPQKVIAMLEEMEKLEVEAES